MAKLDVDTLRRLLRYEPETGRLVWQERTEADCPSVCERRRWNGRYAGQEAFRVNAKGYRAGMIFRSMQKAHRVAWALHHGRWPIGDIDHINGDRSDNRIANLREVTRQENTRNQALRSTNKTGAMGVTKLRGQWRATIYHDGRSKHLGCFASLDEAISARRAAEEAHGYHPNHGRSPYAAENGVALSEPREEAA